MRRALAGGMELDDDRGRIDLDAVHAFLSGESYWARGRPLQTTREAIAGSHRVVGLYCGEEQVGFARSVSDGVTMAYLADVYVLPEHRGHGFGLELVREILDGGDGRGQRLRWMLNTADAQELYRKVGFSDQAPQYPLMERRGRRG